MVQLRRLSASLAGELWQASRVAALSCDLCYIESTRFRITLTALVPRRIEDMDETLATPGTASEKPAKERFAKAIEEAKAGAQALGKEAQERADLYREKVTSQSGEWTAQAKEKASGYANEGKA